MQDTEAVAIIGMAGRFPGARELAEFWANLQAGVESITFFSEEELVAAGVDPELIARPDFVPAKGVVAESDLFAAELFGFNPREAEVMDPQFRLFLECCRQAGEDAGYDLEGHRGRVGVYGGSSASSYLLHNLLSRPDVVSAVGRLQLRISNDRDFLTTWVSYKLDLAGPSVAVQTACSTSLVAVHLACQALLDGDCDLALAGGVSLTFPQPAGYLHQEGGIYSPDGHCRAFDAGAQGSVEGNGVGVVLLKRLADALADGDPVRAVVLGTAMGNDGALKAGYTAPSVDAQARVVAEALSLAGVDPAGLGYVEAHGSGTPLGDPIEVEALTRAFRSAGWQGAGGEGTCGLGSVKSNIGHLDAAAGIAGLIKTVCALEAGRLPPSLHFTRPNPQIDFAAGPFQVVAEARDWPGPGPRRAGVSSFGIGGTNVHAVLEEAPAPAPGGPARPWQLLLLSAGSQEALAETAGRLGRGLETMGESGAPESTLADAAFTLARGRHPLRHRRSLVCRDLADAVALLGGAAPERLAGGEAGDAEVGVAYLLPGLGDHYPGMTAELYATEPIFRREVDRCAELLAPRLGVDLRQVLYPEGAPPPPTAAPGAGGARQGDLRRLLAREPEPADEAEGRLQETRLAHPAVFTVEWALARLLSEWGLAPRAMIGYSLGEYVAAALAGVFSLDDALALVADRAESIDRLPPGALLAVPLAEEELAPLLAAVPGTALAAANGASLSVVGGKAEVVDELARRCAGRGVACRRLRTRHAFHTPLLEPLREGFRQRVAAVERRPPEIPFLSNVTGDWITPEEAADPGYWARHLVATVRFTQGLGSLLGEDGPALLEVGPGQALTTLARQHAGRAAGQIALAALPDRRDGVSEAAYLLHTVGRLWSAGAEVDWEGFYAGQERRRLRLPTTALARRRFWIEAGAGGPAAGAASSPASASPPAPARAADPAGWFYLPSWQRTAPPGAAAGEKGDGETGPWLLFLDDLGLGRALAEELTRRGQRVVTVAAGSSFAPQALEKAATEESAPEPAYRIDPRRREDYGALVSQLAAAGLTPRRVVHLWTVTGDGEAGSWAESDRLERLLDLGTWSLLGLFQALEEAGGDGPVELAVVASHLHEVLAGDAVCPPKAALLGPLKVIPQEASRFTCRSIDLGPAPAPGELSALAARLAADLTAGDGREVVAYRSGHRWRRTFAPVPLPPPPSPAPRLRRDGAYLVTGAAEETGLVVAEHLARSLDARLALLVPPGFPRREEWEAALADGGDGSRDGVIRRLQTLAGEAARLVVLPVELTDAAAVAEAVSQARHRLAPGGNGGGGSDGRALPVEPALDGVIHAAAVPGAGLAQLKTRQAAAPVLAPKIAGTLALAAALAQQPAGFLALFSSTTALTGGIGQVDVAAANAFVDAFAQARAGRLPFTVAVAFSSFQWEGAAQAGVAAGGMGEILAQQQKNLEAFGLAAGEVATALDRVLAADHPQVIVSPRPLEGLIEVFAQVTTDRLLAELARGRPAAGHDRPRLAVDYRPPSTPTEETIARIWGEAFGIAEIGVDDDFFDLEGNSLMAIQIVTRLRSALGVELPMSSLFELPTVARLARRADELGADAGDEGIEEVSALLAEIEGLSSAEAEARLAEGGLAEEGGGEA